jgi:hypothetical protein
MAPVRFAKSVFGETIVRYFKCRSTRRTVDEWDGMDVFRGVWVGGCIVPYGFLE